MEIEDLERIDGLRHGANLAPATVVGDARQHVHPRSESGSRFSDDARSHGR